MKRRKFKTFTVPTLTTESTPEGTPRRLSKYD